MMEMAVVQGGTHNTCKLHHQNT